MQWEDYFSPCEHPQKEGVWIRFCELHTQTGGDLFKITEDFCRRISWVFLAHLKDTEMLEFLCKRAGAQVTDCLLDNPNLPSSCIRAIALANAAKPPNYILKRILEHPNTDTLVLALLKGETHAT
jgi:hypothetical protein